MRNLKPVLHALLVLVVLCTPLSAATAKDVAAKTGIPATPRDTAAIIATAAKAAKEITALQQRKIPPTLLKEATAVIIFPKIAKKSFMVSGGNAGGFLMVREKSGTWSSPLFISVSGGTLGWQIVGDPMDIILLLRNNRQVDALLKGAVTLDSKTTIVPGRVSATMTGASKEELSAEISTYVRSHGVFHEDAVVAGTTLQIDSAANDAYYAAKKVNAADIISGTLTKTSEDLTTLQKALTDYAAVKYTNRQEKNAPPAAHVSWPPGGRFCLYSPVAVISAAESAEKNQAVPGRRD
jgi:lipid-binding SYLF domain-containing protein